MEKLVIGDTMIYAQNKIQKTMATKDISKRKVQKEKKIKTPLL